MEPAELTETQRHALRLCASGVRRGRVAELVGVDPATLWRWRQLAAWREGLAELLEAADAEAADDLRALRGAALEALAELLADAPPAVRLAAAREVLARTGTAGDTRRPALADLSTLTDAELTLLAGY